MDIDIITAKLVRFGMVQSTAKKFAYKIVEEANTHGVDVKEMFADIQDFTLSELGDYLTNTIGVKGYKTGITKRQTASSIVNRTIIK
jgi:hypothetical protein